MDARSYGRNTWSLTPFARQNWFTPGLPGADCNLVPNVSIITLFHNRWDLARLYVGQWREARPNRDDVELIFGDCASTDGAADEAASASDIADVTLFGENLGFSKGNNVLARKARGRFLVFLNYDVQFEGGWLEELVRTFRERSDVGIIGNVQFSVYARMVDHAGIQFDSKGRPGHFRPQVAALQRAGFYPAPAVTGACMAVRRDLFEKLGGFDEGYRNGYEDVDLCMRAEEAGAVVGMAPASAIWHYVGSSPGRFDSEGANAARFAARWSGRASALGPIQTAAPSGLLAEMEIHPLQAAWETLQVYFPTRSGYHETDSMLRLYRRGQWAEVEVPLPTGFKPGESPLRFDPGRNPGRFSVGGVWLRREGELGPFWAVEGHAVEGVCRAGGTCRAEPGGPVLGFEGWGDDPQVLVTLPPGAVGSGGTVWFGVRLRTDCAEKCG